MDIIPKFKKMMYIRQDIFNEFGLQDNPEDIKKLADMQETIKNTARFCFKRCVKLDDSDFSKKEEGCVQTCVKNQIQGVEHLIRSYDMKKELEDIK